jgi:uncharacterized membrane protein
MSKCCTCGVETKEQRKFCKACGAGLSGADASLHDKKARVMGKEKNWLKPAMIAAAVIVASVGLWLARGAYMSETMSGQPQFPPLRDASARLTHAAAVKSEGGEVRVPLADVDDGNAHFFAYVSGGKTITFFVMKAMDGSIRTAYDACAACNHAKLGYRQEGQLVACNNCGMGFKPMDIGKATGGCTPIPVNKSMDGKMIVLKAKDLDDGAKYF